jgi:hypothetical protein
MTSVSYCSLENAYGSTPFELKYNKELYEQDKKKYTEKKGPTEVKVKDIVPEKVKDLPTVDDAFNCNNRNNEFQNNVKEDALRLRPGPQGPQGQNTYGQGYYPQAQVSQGYSQYQKEQQQKPYQQQQQQRQPYQQQQQQDLRTYQSPYFFPYGPQMPINQMYNGYAPQRWVPNPYGPIAFEHYGPWNNNLGSSNSGSSYGREYFGNDQSGPNSGFAGPLFNVARNAFEYFDKPGSPDKKVDKLLNLLTVILIMLFILQFIELISNLQKDS